MALRRLTMADLRDGESVSMPGSGSRPYTLKNVGGVYSCSCPAWRNQSLPIERRACKHLRRLRGDAPAAGGPFERRLRAVERVVRANRPPYARAHEHVECAGPDHLRRELARVEALGGEGLMLRRPGSAYEAGRSPTLLKVKSFADA